MNRRLLLAVTTYGGLCGGGTVVLIYAASLYGGLVFGRWAVVMAVGGVGVGALMFAQAGSSPGTAAGVGGADEEGQISAFDETNADTFAFVAMPTKAALGLYLLGVGVFAVLGLATVA
jgi:hypothetical protein